MQEFDQSASKQIKNLLIVIGSGVISALLIAYLLVTLYSPTGMRRAGDVLLAPGIAQIERIELLYRDDLGNRWVNTRLSEPAYEKIYLSVSADMSGSDVPEAFAFETPATLSVWVTPKNGESYLFQEVQIQEKGRYYRILLHQDTKVPTWAYFTHPGLFEEILKELP